MTDRNPFDTLRENPFEFDYSDDAPRPLAPSSPKLRHARFEAWVGEPSRPGRYACTDEGRFMSLKDAEAWVEANYPNATIKQYTFYSKRDGWKAHAVQTEEDAR